MKTAYSFKKSILNGELHIFQGVLNDDNSCDAGKKSLCKEVNITEGKWHDHSICLSRKIALEMIAIEKDKVCPLCLEIMNLQIKA